MGALFRWGSGPKSREKVKTGVLDWAPVRQIWTGSSGSDGRRQDGQISILGLMALRGDNFVIRKS